MNNHLTPRGVCLPLGYSASGVATGLKVSGKRDCTVVFSEKPASSAAVFTRNLVQAAPVQVSKCHQAKSPHARAIVVTSGNANAATGERGLKLAEAVCRAAAEVLDVGKEEVLIAQTGLIGIQLDEAKACTAVKKAAAALSKDSGVDAMWGMATTDSSEKIAEVQYTFEGKSIAVAGMAKGSGMIAPSMATMIAVITTDASVSPEILQPLLREATDESFNATIVDGACSTNDTLFALANGASETSEITGPEHPGYEPFRSALKQVCHDLAKLIAHDGEGAGKFFEMRVDGARSVEEARMAARAVVGSSLVKCSLSGEAVYWGRILAELGASGAQFDPNEVRIFYGEVEVFARGEELSFPFKEVAEYMKNSEIRISADLGAGDSSAVAYGCDLTYEYVRINMEKS